MFKKSAAMALLISIFFSSPITTSVQAEDEYEPLMDPMVRSDEYLYGVWDSESESWITEPQINYDYSSALMSTENAVKEGDYEKASANLLYYFRNREIDANISPGGVRDSAMVNMWCDNIFYWDSESPLEVFDISSSEQWYNIDVLSSITANRGTFMMFPRYKSDGTAYIYSKESEYSPYIKLKVNGNEKIIYPSDDTMISAGLNQATNYGDESVLLVQDDADYGTNVWCDETTYRPYIRFPIVDAIQHGDEVTEAKLYFYAGADTDNKKVVISTAALQDINEHSFMWKKHVPSTFCYGTYSGWDGLPVVHIRFYQVMYALNEYYYTENEKYAYHSIRHIIDFEKSGLLDSQLDLQIGIQLQKIAPAFCSFVKSPQMTPSAMNAWLKLMLMDGEFLYDDCHFTYDMNFGSNATRGYHMFLSCFPEFTKYDLWIDKVHDREMELMQNLVQDDGSYIESDYGYATTTFALFCDAYDLSLKEGFEFPKWWFDKWEKFAYYFMNSETPNKRLPDWGDNGTGAVPNLSDVADIFDNPYFRYHATNGSEGKEPEYTSVYFPKNHVGIMRDKLFSKDAVFAFCDNKQGGVHSHSEGIHFTIMAYGNYLLTDTGCTSYEKTHPHFNWQRFKSISHNTIDVNDGAANRGMTSAEVDALSDEDMFMNKLFDTFEAETTAFSDAKYWRDITYIKPLGMFICSDLLNPMSAAENKYNQAWHTLANARLTYDEDTKAARTNFNSLANLQIVPLDPEELNKVHEINGSTDVLSDGYAYFDNINIRNCISAKFVNYEKYATDDVTFDTILYASKAEDMTDVSAERLDTGYDRTAATAFRIELKNNEKVSEAYYMLNRQSENSFIQIPFGDFSSDGRMTYVEKDTEGNISSIMARDVSKIYYNNQLLLDLGDKKAEDISVKYNGSYIYIYGKDDEISCSLFKIADTDVVYVNDTRLVPNIKGNHYIIGSDTAVYSKNTNASGVPEVLSDRLLLRNDSVSMEVEHGTLLCGEGWDYTLTLPVISKGSVDSVGNVINIDFKNELVSHKPVKLTINNTAIRELYINTDNGYVVCDNSDGVRFENNNGNAVIYMTRLRDLAYTAQQKSSVSSGSGGSSGGGGGSVALQSNGGIYETKKERTAVNGDEFKAEETARTAEFEDLAGHWAESAVNRLYELGIINGRDEHTFDPESEVSRAEFATMIRMAMGLETDNGIDSEFVDVSDEDWFRESVAAVSENKIMVGDDGVFRPFDAITREEAATTVVRAVEYVKDAINAGGNSFIDYDFISDWAKEYVSKAAANGIMNGMPDGRFCPKYLLTRAEAAQLILNMTELNREELTDDDIQTEGFTEID